MIALCKRYIRFNYHILTMFVAVVPVENTFLQRTGRMPTGTLLKVKSIPSTVVTLTWPDTPMYNALVGMISFVSCGVIAAPPEAGALRLIYFPLCVCGDISLLNKREEQIWIYPVPPSTLGATTFSLIKRYGIS